ncbi:MAG: hypothetical protein ACK4P4_07065 [Allorhizobium sp.]
MRRLVMLAAATLLTMGMAGTAPAIEIRSIAGHTVEVREKDFQKALFVNGREIHTNEYITFDSAYVLSGSIAIVGSSSPGGNACNSSPFVLSFPAGGSPRFDGPLETCFAVDYRVEGDRLKFSTKKVPGHDQERWEWSAQEGIQMLASIPFAPDSALGWEALRERSMSHPSEAFANAGIAKSLSDLLGTDFEQFQNLMAGVGSGQFKGDDFVGTSCRRHICLDEAGLIFLSGREQRAYAAWKPEGGKIIVYPAPVKDWPEKAKVELREWARTWE